LKEAVNQLEAGQADANLGSNVYKLRIARSGEGKSGGYRLIVLFRNEERTFYIYGYTKSNRSNISEKELRSFKLASKKYFMMTDEHIDIAVKNDELIEI